MLFDYDDLDPASQDEDLSSLDPMELTNKEKAIEELDTIEQSTIFSTEDEFDRFLDYILQHAFKLDQLHESGERSEPDGE